MVLLISFLHLSYPFSVLPPFLPTLWRVLCVKTYWDWNLRTITKCIVKGGGFSFIFIILVGSTPPLSCTLWLSLFPWIDITFTYGMEVWLLLSLLSLIGRIDTFCHKTYIRYYAFWFSWHMFITWDQSFEQRVFSYLLVKTLLKYTCDPNLFSLFDTDYSRCHKWRPLSSIILPFLILLLLGIPNLTWVSIVIFEY